MICPAPLPEDPADAHLIGLLVPAPHVVPEKKATETRKSSRRLGVLGSSPNNPAAPSASEDEEEEEEEASPPPTGGGKKRKAAPTGKAGGSKKGKTLLPDYASGAEADGEEWPSRVKPLERS